MNTKNMIISVVVIVVVAVGGFFGGVAFQKHKGTATPTAATASRTGAAGAAGAFAGRGGTRGAGGAAGAGGFGGGVTGQIISMDSSSITVKTASGSTEIVYFSGTTAVTKEDTASSSDLATGDDVVVRGSTSSGAVTATNISIVPALPTPPMGGAANGAGAPAAGAAPAGN